MGINNLSLVLHSISSLSMEEIKRLALCVKNSYDKSCDQQRPSIDIDSSWLAYNCGTAKSNSVKTLINIGVAFVDAGFDICIVCNSLDQYPWRRASYKQAADRARAGIKARMNQICLNKVVNKLSNSNIREIERATLLKEKKTLSSSIKSLESRSRRAICNNF
mmetsp:Transcript_34206/g.41916  ORF Transcript_34206/g.41916 Transcript_34206/m.41916 type:complete len:163 (-) Transcript_34206:26-514(-)